MTDVKTEMDRLEGQLRHLTLPTQRGYRGTIERRLNELRNGALVELSESDKAIIEALRYPSTRFLGRKGKIIKPWLYAVADPWDSRKSDLSRWFVTGPQDRPGYIRGPFEHEQVKRIAATGRLAVVCCEEDEPVAYELKHGVIGIDA